MEMAETRKPLMKFETLVAILIAITTLLGALVAWLASVSDGVVGDSDYAGLQATLNAEEARMLNNVMANEHYAAYLQFYRNEALGDAIAMEILETDDELRIEALESLRANSHDIALSSEHLYPSKFIARDGTYSVQRELGELWADAARKNSLNPEPQFIAADQARNKTGQLMIALTILSIALVFYTLVESFGQRMQYVMVSVGTVLLLVGVAFTFWIEFLA
jgi:uncharacterized Tic20 family protein